MLGIGIDTGGTCTDAVIYDFAQKRILAGAKALTTKEHLETGIAAALDALPEALVEKAGMVGLSTTLATNACLENKGARGKLLLLGFDWEMIEHLKDIYASYGLKDLTRFIVMDAKVEGIYSKAYDPDWDELSRKAPEWFADCDSIGIVQKHPRANGGRFELRALEILKGRLQQPITISYEISNEVDVLKTCAGTMLNARLIPLISEFMEAVHRVLLDRGLSVPITIVRSDGTIMSEEMARTYPVETILCGPSASVVGGSELAGERSGIIVDMGGTTTDIAIIRKNQPVLAEDGIYIGQWKTMVRGLYVETFGLGGDTAVRYKNGELYLDTIRVIPLSVLASRYDHVLPYLRRLAEEKHFYTSQAHEFYVLLKDISDKIGYTDFERQICSFLVEKPLSALELGERIGLNPSYISTERLEEDGVIIKSGLTPTDMMVLKGDFPEYDKAAAEAAVESLTANIHDPVSLVPDLVYEMVIRRLYDNLAYILLKHQFPGKKDFSRKEDMKAVLDCLYEDAVKRLDFPDAVREDIAGLRLGSAFPLIGVGAPVHIFLPRVASLLGTRVVIPEYAGVANALGAVACRRSKQLSLIVKSVYEGTYFRGFSVFEDGRRHMFKDLNEAVSFGKEVAVREGKKWAKAQGLETEPRIELAVYENRLHNRPDGLLFEVRISALFTEK